MDSRDALWMRRFFRRGCETRKGTRWVGERWIEERERECKLGRCARKVRGAWRRVPAKEMVSSCRFWVVPRKVLRSGSSVSEGSSFKFRRSEWRFVSWAEIELSEFVEESISIGRQW